jgi:hypothetical protein
VKLGGNRGARPTAKRVLGTATRQEQVRARPCPYHQSATGERLYVTAGHRSSARWPMVADAGDAIAGAYRPFRRRRRKRSSVKRRPQRQGLSATPGSAFLAPKTDGRTRRGAPMVGPAVLRPGTLWRSVRTHLAMMQWQNYRCRNKIDRTRAVHATMVGHRAPRTHAVVPAVSWRATPV